MGCELVGDLDRKERKELKGSDLKNAGLCDLCVLCGESLICSGDLPDWVAALSLPKGAASGLAVGGRFWQPRRGSETAAPCDGVGVLTAKIAKVQTWKMLGFAICAFFVLIRSFAGLAPNRGEEGKMNASEGQMNASEGQMNASEEQMNASEEQMNALEGQMNASEGHMNASEEQMNASEGQMNASEGDMNASVL